MRLAAVAVQQKNFERCVK